MKELNDRELLLLAYLDGDLDAAGKQRAEALMAEDAAFTHEYRLLTGTRLEPETIIYTDKHKLKRTAKVNKSPLRFVIPATAVAACMALLVLLYNPGTKTGSSATGLVTPADKEITYSNAPGTKEIAAPKEAKIINNPAKINTQEKHIQTPVKTQEPTEAETIVDNRIEPEMLVAKRAEINIELPELYTLTEPVYTEPIIIAAPGKKGFREWYANAEKKVNNFMGYLQKPKINIRRTGDNGQQRLVIRLKADKYDVEREVLLSVK